MRNLSDWKRYYIPYWIMILKIQGSRVFCDLILHSRGEKPEQDNLIVLEMKKAGQLLSEKEEDKRRLKEMTSDTSSCPECVGQYVLGVYYEINFENNEIMAEYCHHGLRSDKRKFSF